MEHGKYSKFFDYLRLYTLEVLFICHGLFLAVGFIFILQNPFCVFWAVYGTFLEYIKEPTLKQLKEKYDNDKDTD